ncbi:DUF2303 family protein [Pseudomonas neustonica]|uniref:DUF2303 family protein n=1 Tax=Pseudomonas neustonica TaxID=2487346 RepID=A0ABX9XHT9_9PSED|nr:MULTISPECIES: DUF2303 family protein [Pseudomonas]ROZ80923.1 DUF2303 family protein [Pseudomonas sp. SSM44]ROZ82121.1 DUF2303 family protein [Pseudomonas neustonica]|tara:strand:+ start:1661 stop:2482 length:822 start_codon:yes stop_codon:yes gene_type:complete
MTLPLDTLERITDTHAAANGKPLNTNTPAILLPHQFSVESLEQLEAHRARFRGRLATQSFRDFCAYVEQHQKLDDLPQGFVDQDDMSCTVLFNLGDQNLPGHGDDKATLKLKPTAAFKAMQQMAGRAHKQADLAEWMEDWHEFITVLDSTGEGMPVSAAVQKIRTITIKAQAERTSTETTFGAQRSSMDSIEAAHAEKQPADLLFLASPYDGLEARTFTLRLSILTSEPPVIKPRWVMQEQQEEEMAQEFKDKLTAEIGGLCQLTVGTFALGQ